MAIDTADARKIDTTKCIGCMRCVKICPQHAKALETATMAGFESVLEKSVWNINPVNCEVDRSQAGMICVRFNRGIQPVKYEFTEI